MFLFPEWHWCTFTNPYDNMSAAAGAHTLYQQFYADPDEDYRNQLNLRNIRARRAVRKLISSAFGGTTAESARMSMRLLEGMAIAYCEYYVTASIHGNISLAPRSQIAKSCTNRARSVANRYDIIHCVPSRPSPRNPRPCNSCHRRICPR